MCFIGTPTYPTLEYPRYRAKFFYYSSPPPSLSSSAFFKDAPITTYLFPTPLLAGEILRPFLSNQSLIRPHHTFRKRRRASPFRAEERRACVLAAREISGIDLLRAVSTPPSPASP